MATVFISGSISIKRLPTPVQQRLYKVVENGHRVVVGDANGADVAVQRELVGLGAKKVTVYHSGRCRNNQGNWKTVSVPASGTGRAYHRAKDRAMQKVADYGFAIWDGESVGTHGNISVLLSLSKRCLVWNHQIKGFLSQEATALCFA